MPPASNPSLPSLWDHHRLHTRLIAEPRCSVRLSDGASLLRLLLRHEREPTPSLRRAGQPRCAPAVAAAASPAAPPSAGTSPTLGFDAPPGRASLLAHRLRVGSVHGVVRAIVDGGMVSSPFLGRGPAIAAPCRGTLRAHCKCCNPYSHLPLPPSSSQERRTVLAHGARLGASPGAIRGRVLSLPDAPRACVKGEGG